MGLMKKKGQIVQRSVRFPPDLYRWIERYASSWHGGNITATVIRLLYEAKDNLKTIERWKREGAARDADAMTLQRDRSLKEKDGSSP